MLENIEIFSWLSAQDLNTLELFCQERIYKKSEVVFSKWEEATAMYIVKSWELEVLDDFRVLWVVKHWDIVWEMAIFLNKNIRSATVKALKESELIVILKFSIDDLILKHPHIYIKIEEIINNRTKQNLK